MYDAPVISPHIKSRHIRDDSHKNIIFMNQLLRSSATALAKAIRSGEVSSEEIVGAHIKRIEEVNPRLNAVVQLTVESAMAQAREAAIIAACGSPLGLGSDAGGSQRVPAHFCGIATLRPTNGRVSRAGHFPPIEGLFGEVLAVGPMARYVEDLILTLPLIAGQDWRDPWTVPAPIADPRTVELQKLRVAFYTDNGVAAPTPEVIAAVKSSESVLSDCCSMVEERVPDGLPQLFELYLELMAVYANTEMETLLQSTSMDDVYPALRRALETLRGAKPSLNDYANMMSNWRQFQSRMLSFMRDYDVIICPAAHSPAPPHEATDDDQYIAILSHAMPYGLTGWPAVVTRAGSSPEGLPIGVQIVASPWREDVALAVAQRLEEAFGGWKPPAIFE